MAELAQESTAYEVVEGEPPEILSRNLSSGSHLLASGSAFFFLTFFFAYFYLRSLNNAGMFKPKGIDAPVGWGTAIAACIVASVLLVRLGAADQRAGRRSAWRAKGSAALGLGLAALVLQAVEWTQTSFGPTDGSYAGIFFGWTAFLFLFVLLTMFWLETIVATSFRYRSASSGAGDVPAGHASGDPYRQAHDIRDPVQLNAAELGALSFYWTFLAGIAVVAWIVLYLV